MRWQDDGLIVGLKSFSEKDLRAILFTHDHGLCSALVRRSFGKKTAITYSVGDLVQTAWNARLEQHLGRFALERYWSTAPLIFPHPQKLLILQHCCMLMLQLPQGHPYPHLYHDIKLLCLTINQISIKEALIHMAFLEKSMIAELGFGIDISRCCVTGKTDDLIYISPKTARAVSSKGAGDYAQSLLKLPAFWKNKTEMDPATISAEEIRHSLETTLFFLYKWILKKPEEIGLFRKKISVMNFSD